MAYNETQFFHATQFNTQPIYEQLLASINDKTISINHESSAKKQQLAREVNNFIILILDSWSKSSDELAQDSIIQNLQMVNNLLAGQEINIDYYSISGGVEYTKQVSTPDYWSIKYVIAIGLALITSAAIAISAALFFAPISGVFAWIIGLAVFALAAAYFVNATANYFEAKREVMITSEPTAIGESVMTIAGLCKTEPLPVSQNPYSQYYYGVNPQSQNEDFDPNVRVY